MLSLEQEDKGSESGVEEYMAQSMDVPQSVDVWSRREQQVVAEWKTKPVSTRECKCAMFGAGGCSRLEWSGGVNQYTPHSGNVLLVKWEDKNGRITVEECPWVHQRA